MKKIILLLVLLTSCGPSKEEMERLQNQGKDYDIKIIDGCEYINYQGNLTHKANCKNHK